MPSAGNAASLGPVRLGVLALGDSITNGGGELQWGVALQSWALWVARGLGLPFSAYATDGARVEDVVGEQIPAAITRNRRADLCYDLGCLYIGVNDVRGFDWDPGRFAAAYGEALQFLREHCDRVLAVTAPLELGRPRAGAKVRDLNSVIERAAAEHGALLLDLSEFGARNLVMTDHVHPTAFGQIAIAERALDLLAGSGMTVVARPSSLIHYRTSRWRRLRSDATYVYRHLKVSARALALRAWFGLPMSRSRR